jgi:hypothetical protein
VKKTIISLATSAALVLAPIAYAADTKAPQTQTQTQTQTSAAPLPAGNAAGVKQAQFANTDLPIEFWVGSALVLAFAIWAVLQDDDDIDTVTTTTTAP